MTTLQQTVLYDCHLAHGAQMVDFGGWNMPIQYPTGIITEHLATRKHAGMFDVSHMGRFRISGNNALPFLQYVLTNNAAALPVGKSHYSIMANPNGGAIDDVYLYRFLDDEYLLVVNASNRQKDWGHFQKVLVNFPDVSLQDKSEEMAMISVQGADSEKLVAELLDAGTLPAPQRNALSIATIERKTAYLARTGYTGEVVGFELFVPCEIAAQLWERLHERGAMPIGLGARDTLRLEAGLPLYGHEFGTDQDGNEIPIFAVPASKIAVNFAPEKGDFIGKAALQQQYDALQAFAQQDFSRIAALPRRVRLLAITGKGIARAGDSVFQGDRRVGYVTSGTMVPYWKYQDEGAAFQLLEETGKRAIALALLDSSLANGVALDVEIRGKRAEVQIVAAHLKKATERHVRAII
ncbi:aminomethyltransferase [Candidatus Moduliflexus flocculans]|uniref:Aminomethyltransferase n=1 Tax=Candidatus Moduliflexus flocculans TaxID=1499966 RepID=A0A0S6W4N9_9BACT|nr:aminomethyltransferase [Candidatus Moduliflexus flocculans]